MKRLTPLLFVVVALTLCSITWAAGYRTKNFVCYHADPEWARETAKWAEHYRAKHAKEWLGIEDMPAWSQPCQITLQVGHGLGNGGATTFVFDRGEVFGWRMSIQGTPERVLDSVLPHEVLHTIFATHFRRPLPRWADEGACTTVEHHTERNKYNRQLVTFLRTDRGIAFNRMFAMREYPHDVQPLYAQSHSLADYLIQKGGRRWYVLFLERYFATGDWTASVKEFYGDTSIKALQDGWLAWVKEGSPRFQGMRPVQGELERVAARKPVK